MTTLAPPSSLPDYVELQCLSNFSFLRGASWPEELVERAAKLGYSGLALTDECSLAGIVRAHVESKKLKFPLLIGSQLRIDDANGDPALTLVILVCNKQGYGNLSELITLARARAEKGSYLLQLEDFSNPAAAHRHLLGLPDCLAILVPEYGVPLQRLSQQAAWMAQIFSDRCWISLCLLNHAGDTSHRLTVEQAARERQLPVVASGHVEMHVRSRKPLHDVLCAIRLRQSVAECGYALAPNAEQHLRARVHLSSIYPAQALQETLNLARRCSFNLDHLKYEYPEEIVPLGQTPTSYLREQTYAGAHRRYPDGIPAHIRQRLEEELELIQQLEYEAYFLTVYDVVKFATDRKILCQGRGSAANSIVCFCLGITAVKPEITKQLFGRFISKERGEPPDIDVDFEHKRREEVIQYIYKKYGRARAALTAVVSSYRSRSALRDVGKALGVDAAVVDLVAKAHQWWDGKKKLHERFESCGLDASSAVAQRWSLLAEQLMGFPRHLSQHPGGFVIARDTLSRLVPIENAAMPERSVVQWDKDDLDAVGLLKVDILALGMLTALRRALELIRQPDGRPYALYELPSEDTATYDMICKADTIGVFQIESRAQMSMLPRLRPREFYDLVIQVAIVRPGPIQGGMVHPYLQRRHGNEPEQYPPGSRLPEALARTKGVPIFQEQVMQVAMLAAGFSEGKADELRRAMAAWKRKGNLDKYYEDIVSGMLKNGYQREFAEAIFRQIQGFGEYGFPESHAASFALLAYASAWLKCHHPEAFLTALLNSQPMGFYTPYQLIQDAQRHGVEVRAVDVCISNYEASLETTMHRPAVRLGLNQVQGLCTEAALRIEQARAQRAFSDTADLGRRADLDQQALQALAGADALQQLAGHRRLALWEAIESVPQRGLLRDAIQHEAAPPLELPCEADSITADYRSLKLTLRRHPLALLRSQLTARGFLASKVLQNYPDRRLARACGIVTVRQRPGTAKGVIFITLEDETGQVNVIVHSKLVDQQRKELLGSTLLGVYGTWQSHQGVQSLLAKRLVDLSFLLGELVVESRNFH